MKEFILGIAYVLFLAWIYPHIQSMEVLKHGGGDVGIFSAFCAPLVLWIMQKFETYQQ